ncbi:hypothetical protein, partial [Rhizobium phaseoli]|uniref:hypothetical protein n=1 Tax=Rhizobium phaseoli TaxID=396 RepID=UPI000E2C80FE
FKSRKRQGAKKSSFSPIFLRLWKIAANGIADRRNSSLADRLGGTTHRLQEFCATPCQTCRLEDMRAAVASSMNRI